MKRLNSILSEAEENAAHKQAVSMGLKYKGFGYWQDPNSGEVKFKTENDQLVPVEQEQAAELGDPLKAGMPGAGGGPAGQNPGDLGMGAQMQQPMGMMPGVQPGSMVKGAPEPGEELVPTTLEWEPGPDGSTCVDTDTPPGQVPEDSFVSRTNNLKWGAGPDGTNYSNIDYRELLKDLRSPNLDSFLNRMDTQSMMGRLKEGLTFFDMFMSEAPMQSGMGGRTAADEAHQAGLSYSGYGYWRDKTGQVVAKTVDNQLQYIEQGQQPQTAATLDMGNPTSKASGMTPADKARTMGLISNGSGGYVDQEGNVVARTVNNELVFYDSRAGGGAVSDGSGGALITQSAPSWVDPVTGLIVVPPAQPESPEEINAVPDAVPATAPAGYDAFVNKKKREMYRQNYIQTQAQQEIDTAQAEMDEMFASHPAMQQLHQEMQELAAKTEEGGDPHKIGALSYAQRDMEENAEKYKSYFDQIPGEKHPQLAYLIKKQALAKAKAEYRYDNHGKTIEMPPSWLYAYDKQLEATDEINEMLDSNNPDIEYYPKISKKKEPPLTYEGNGITYDLSVTRLNGFNLDIAKKADDVLREQGSNMRVPENPKIFNIDWFVSEGDGSQKFDTERNREALGPAQSKRLALNALKTWRQEVLPSLTPGMIVMANPMADEEEIDDEGIVADNQRARIYSLAGFGQEGGGIGIEGMFGIVQSDEDGYNKVVPINPSEKQRERMKINEVYLCMLDGELNMQERILLEQFLL